MNAEQIVETAKRLQCGPDEAAVAFARMLAEHCAQIADEHPGAAANAIRAAFHTRESVPAGST